MHRWSDDDNLVAYCLFRLGNGAFSQDRHTIGDLLGMGFNSLNLKVANFKAIAGQGGLEQYSQQAVQIFTKYSKMTDDEVKQAGNAALSRAYGSTKPDSESSLSSLSKEALEAKLVRAQRDLDKMSAQLDMMRKSKGQK